MPTELVFRLFFIAAWLVFIGSLVWVRVKHRRPLRVRQVARPSRPRAVALALFAPFWFSGMILYAIYPSAIASLSIPLPVWFRCAMALVAASTIPFINWSNRALGKNWVHALDAATFRKRKDQVLVTSGPYRYIRNPIYLGSFVLVIAFALVAANWLLLVPALFLVGLVYRQIPNEEAMLLERFGDEYRDYSRCTPRLIPSLRPKGRAGTKPRVGGSRTQGEGL